MLNRKIKKTIIFIIFTSFINFIFAFDWPITDVETNTTASYFGQNKGSTLSPSIIFTNPSEVNATEKGKVLILLTEETDDSDFFPSTLGTSYIIQHEDNLISVYGNLDTEEILSNDNLLSKNVVTSGENLGYSGDSGWQDKKTSLEFQIIDTLSKSAINPQILLSKSTEKAPISIQNVYLENRNGDFYDIKTTRNYPSGIYRFYETRDKVMMPYKSSILINGVLTDQISYDTIIQESGKSCVIGKKKYSSADIYPNDNLLLLGEAMLTAGRTAVTLSVQNIFEENKQVIYTISVY